MRNNLKKAHFSRLAAFLPLLAAFLPLCKKAGHLLTF
jgi:hypothetical protein